MPTATTKLLVREVVARLGHIDRRAQADVRSAQRSDTPPPAADAPERLSPSARERAAEGEGLGLAHHAAESGGVRPGPNPARRCEQSRRSCECCVSCTWWSSRATGVLLAGGCARSTSSERDAQHSARDAQNSAGDAQSRRLALHGPALTKKADKGGSRSGRRDEPNPVEADESARQLLGLQPGARSCGPCAGGSGTGSRSNGTSRSPSTSASAHWDRLQTGGETVSVCPRHPNGVTPAQYEGIPAGNPALPPPGVWGKFATLIAALGEVGHTTQGPGGVGVMLSPGASSPIRHVSAPSAEVAQPSTPSLALLAWR
jgi:hypothetical protein